MEIVEVVNGIGARVKWLTHGVSAVHLQVLALLYVVDPSSPVRYIPSLPSALSQFRDDLFTCLQRLAMARETAPLKPLPMARFHQRIHGTVQRTPSLPATRLFVLLLLRYPT
ncbi:hypothetical protein D9M69_591590 [compost metagenome]